MDTVSKIDNTYERVSGVDVSHHQGHINWDVVKAAGFEFAFIKASEGTSFIDPAYHGNMEACRLRANMLAGPYHYYRLHLDPAQQANHFCDVVGSLHQGDLQPVLDMEEPGTEDSFRRGESYLTIVRAIQVMVPIIQQRLGRDPIIYTYPSFWKVQAHNSPAFAQTLALWIADYRGRSAPELVGTWPRWSFWQYTSKGQVPGITGFVDRNIFNGKYTQLRKFAGY